MLMAIAAYIAGRPDSIAAGTRTVPTVAVAGVGQRNSTAIYMTRPKVKNTGRYFHQ